MLEWKMPLKQRVFMTFPIQSKVTEEKWKVRIISCFEWSDVQR